MVSAALILCTIIIHLSEQLEFIEATPHDMGHVTCLSSNYGDTQFATTNAGVKKVQVIKCSQGWLSDTVGRAALHPVIHSIPCVCICLHHAQAVGSYVYKSKG